MNPLTQSRNTTILPVLIALASGRFWLSPQAGAVCQQGCVTDENTRLGEDALLRYLLGGYDNTADGASARKNNTTGFANAATITSMRSELRNTNVAVDAGPILVGGKVVAPSHAAGTSQIV